MLSKVKDSGLFSGYLSRGSLGAVFARVACAGEGAGCPLVTASCQLCELDIDDVFEYFEHARKAGTSTR
jgi:hypothetical protein